MDRNYFRYEDSHGRPVKAASVFGWSIAILLLTGLAFTAWIGSFYVFGQPERPQSYKILKKLHKIEPTKRFELTAAPAGEFLTAKQLYDRYLAMSPTELEKANAEMLRNYIRNFQRMRGLVPYVVGRFNIMDARELTQDDVFTSGMIALTNSVEHSEVIMEHVYPADPQSLPLMKQTLMSGLEIKLERTHDLSAVIHAERLGDGRMLITAMPLLYGSYTMARAPGTFTLEPPTDMNLKAGWPILKDSDRTAAETRYRERTPQDPSPTAGRRTCCLITSATRRADSSRACTTGGDAEDCGRSRADGETDCHSKRWQEVGKEQEGGHAHAGSNVAVAAPLVASPGPNAAAPAPQWQPPPSRSATAATPASIAVAQTSSAAVPPPVSAAAGTPAPDDALASTAGGGSWKTFPPGKMPVRTADSNVRFE